MPGLVFGEGQVLATPLRKSRLVWSPVAVEVMPLTSGGAVASSVVVTNTSGSPACTDTGRTSGLFPPVKVTVNVKPICSGQAAAFERLNWKGVELTALAPPGISGYAEVPLTMVTPGVEVVRVAEIAVAPCVVFAFVSWMLRLPHSPGPTKPSPLPEASVRVFALTKNTALGPVAATAMNASRMPWPLSRSAPAAWMSIVEDVRIELICEAVRLGFADLTSAAMAPACGAAAEVP